MIKQPKSWRDVMAVHPAADLFPLMAPDELKVLGKDIKKNGLKEAIALTYEKPGGGPCQYSLIDGRNRLDAMELVGLSPNLQLYRGIWKLTLAEIDNYGLVQPIIVNDDPYTYVLSKNMHRRHLTAEHKREIIAKMLKAQPSKSNRTIATQAKVSHVTVAAVRDKLEGRGQIDHVEKHTDTKGRKQPAQKLSTKKKCRDLDDSDDLPDFTVKAAPMLEAKEVGARSAPQRADIEDGIVQCECRASDVQRILEAIEELDDQQLAELKATLMQKWSGGLGVPVENPIMTDMTDAEPCARDRPI